MKMRPLMIGAFLLVLLTTVVEARNYSADKYDVHATLLRGGAMQVTETIVLRFDGTYTQFYRQITTRRTDGIEFGSASMDGVPLTPGTGPGHVEVSGSSRVRVRWHFAPETNSTHTFQLTYTVNGVVRDGDAADLLAWRALPGEHDYRIASSTIDFDLPSSVQSPPEVRDNRTGRSRVESDDAHVRITAEDIRKNGWIEAWIRMPKGSVIDTPPQWRVREQKQTRMSGTWISIAAGVFVAGLLLLFGARQGYDPPPQDAGDPSGGAIPDTLPPAIAGTLVNNGSPRMEQAMAALFSLADRGELAISEEPRSLGHRQFMLTRTPTGAALAGYEQAALDIILTGRQGREPAVPLTTARRRMMRRFPRFSTAVGQHLKANGLIDEGRVAVRTYFKRIGLLALIVGGASVMAAAAVVDQYGPLTMLVPMAAVLVGLVAFIAYAAHTPLSNDAVRRSNRWRSFQRHLRDVARDRAPAPSDIAARALLPFAVAIGLAPAWARYLKNHAAAVPPWFHAMAGGDGGHAFSAFVATGGAGSGGGHAAGGAGGAAGGGSSGAS